MLHCSFTALRLCSLVLVGLGGISSVGFIPTSAAWAQAGMEPGKIQRNFTIDDIQNADYTGGELPVGQSALTAKVQILLDRSGISPGVVDGWRGGMSESAIMAFQRRAGLPMNGRMSPVVWQLLQPFAHDPMISDYTITEDDAHGLVDRIPSDYGEKAQMSSQGYTSIPEKLGERFHMDEKFLVKLNPGVAFEPGATIRVTTPAKAIRGSVTRIIVDKATRRVAAYDAKGRMIADYPATVGSAATPSPHGTHYVDAVALNPTYTYNPNKNFKQGNNDRVLTIPPGPNGPVGNVWIDLSEPTYGIHGTATPSRLFVNQSNGCVRLTNWDARELAGMVKPGTTVVEFLDPGVSIADVTGSVPTSSAASTVATAVTAVRPIARPALPGMAGTPAPALEAAIDQAVQSAQSAPLTQSAPPPRRGSAQVIPANTAPAASHPAVKTAPVVTAPVAVPAIVPQAPVQQAPVQQAPIQQAPVVPVPGALEAATRPALHGIIPAEPSLTGVTVPNVQPAPEQAPIGAVPVQPETGAPVQTFPPAAGEAALPSPDVSGQ